MNMIRALLIALFFVAPTAVFINTAHASDAAAALSWTAPTTRTDGSPLAATQIAEYRVYYVIDGPAPTTTGDGFTSISGASNATTLSFDFTPRAEPYTVHFAITAVDTKGLESALSEVRSLTFNVESTAIPSTPTSIRIEFNCGSGCVIKPVQ